MIFLSVDVTKTVGLKEYEPMRSKFSLLWIRLCSGPELQSIYKPKKAVIESLQFCFAGRSFDI